MPPPGPRNFLYHKKALHRLTSAKGESLAVPPLLHSAIHLLCDMAESLLPWSVKTLPLRFLSESYPVTGINRERLHPRCSESCHCFRRSGSKATFHIPSLHPPLSTVSPQRISLIRGNAYSSLSLPFADSVYPNYREFPFICQDIFPLSSLPLLYRTSSLRPTPGNAPDQEQQPG